ncbi:MAG: NADH:ubiquinone reductase (Na(+)-transporting) subunit C [Pseudomonadales bacterium]
MKNESTSRALLTVAAVALVCSAMVATSVYLLQPMQKAYAQIDRNRSILRAAGIDTADMDDDQVVTTFLALDARIIDLSDAVFTSAPAMTTAWGYDHWSSADRTAGIAARYVPAYLVWRDGGLARLVVPVDGAGMWSTIYGYLALEPDLNTVAELIIYRHGETPGVGDRIEDPRWLAEWAGKRLVDDAGDVRVTVVKNPQAGNFQVHLISGASVTSEAVGGLIRRWAGPEGYGPLLQRLRRDPAALSPP